MLVKSNITEVINDWVAVYILVIIAFLLSGFPRSRNKLAIKSTDQWGLVLALIVLTHR